MTLERQKGSIPLYMQIARELESRILSGEYPTGSIVPSEKQLQAMYMVSRMTVRMAIGDLVNKGYVECMRGIGTMVTYGKIEEKLKRIVSFTEEMQQHGITMETTHCTIERCIASDIVAKALEVEAGTEVSRLVRVRNAKDRAVVYSVTHLNVPGLPLDTTCYTDSLYSFLSDSMHTTVCHCDDTLEAVMADANVSSMLHVSKHSPIFKRTRIARDGDMHVIEYSVSYYSGDRYKYSVHL